MVLIINQFLPETPFYLVMIDRDEDAKSSLARFRHDTYNINRELDEMMEFKIDNNIRRLFCLCFCNVDAVLQRIRISNVKVCCTVMP